MNTKPKQHREEKNIFIHIVGMNNFSHDLGNGFAMSYYTIQWFFITLFLHLFRSFFWISCEFVLWYVCLFVRSLVYVVILYKLTVLSGFTFTYYSFFCSSRMYVCVNIFFYIKQTIRKMREFMWKKLIWVYFTNKTWQKEFST